MGVVWGGCWILSLKTETDIYFSDNIVSKKCVKSPGTWVQTEHLTKQAKMPSHSRHIQRGRNGHTYPVLPHTRAPQQLGYWGPISLSIGPYQIHTGVASLLTPTAIGETSNSQITLLIPFSQGTHFLIVTVGSQSISKAMLGNLSPNISLSFLLICIIRKQDVMTEVTK